MQNDEKPKTLYKFRSWTNPDEKTQAFHRSLLTESKLWVPVATDLNDPRDCCIPFRYDLMEYDDCVARFAKLRADRFPTMPIAQRREWAKARIEGLGIYDPERKSEVLEGFAQQYRAKQGVLSFSTEGNDPLLWSRYADCHRGYCIGLDYNRFRVVMALRLPLRIGLLEGEVRYVSEFPVVIPSDDGRQHRDSLVQLLFTKSKHWEPENEYRYVFPQRYEFPIEFDASCVSEVILGSEMSDKDGDDIRAIAQKRFPSAKLFQAKKKPFAFELEFMPLD